MNDPAFPALEEVADRLEDEPRNHPFLWGLSLIFLIFSVPFYYPAEREPAYLWGLPDWCWVTLLCDTLFAATVAYLILKTWKERTPAPERTDADSRGA
jgi:hypothetical protein